MVQETVQRQASRYWLVPSGVSVERWSIEQKQAIVLRVRASVFAADRSPRHDDPTRAARFSHVWCTGVVRALPDPLSYHKYHYQVHDNQRTRDDANCHFTSILARLMIRPVRHVGRKVEISERNACLSFEIRSPASSKTAS
jgi:hypothetical protein